MLESWLEQYAFRAGTIQTVAERNAIGYVKGYLEKQEIEDVREARIKYLAKRIEGVNAQLGNIPAVLLCSKPQRNLWCNACSISSKWYICWLVHNTFWLPFIWG